MVVGILSELPRLTADQQLKGFNTLQFTATKYNHGALAYNALLGGKR